MDRRTILAGIGSFAVAACSRQSSGAATSVAPSPRKAPHLQVHKSTGCTCCDAWVAHMKSAGFTANVDEVADVGPVKSRLGVPANLVSCHTAEVDGYFLEGHVPAADALRLLVERPTAKGLTVPGMPLGSPGMEVPGQSQAYDVLLVAADGSTRKFAHHEAQQPG